MLLVDAGGYGGRIVGRLYRNEHEYRRIYRERANVGGFFGSILDSSEFDMFLSLLCCLITLNVIQSHLTSAPVTAFAILLMLFLHFEKSILGERNTFLTSENYNKYSFNPQRILDGQWHRLITGPLLHKGRKLHLYLNMSALVILTDVERRSILPVMLYGIFFLGLTALSGLLYILCMKKYKKRGEQGLNSYRASTAGFTGVVFALKVYHNTYKAGTSGMAFPLAGDLYTYSIPVEVPSFAEHFVELFLVMVLFGNDVPFWSNVGGILAGYLFVGLETTLVAMGLSRPWSNNNYRIYSTDSSFGHSSNHSIKMLAVKQACQALFIYVKENGILFALLAVVATYVHKSMKEKERKFQRRLEELEREQEETKEVKQGNPVSHSLYEDVPREVPLSNDNASAASAGQGSWSLTQEQGPSDSQEDDGSKALSSGESLYDDCTISEIGLPPEFTAALKTLTFVTESQDQAAIAKALRTMLTLITNAVTKGQGKGEQADKYRRIRISNPRFQECNINGAFDLIKAVGFQVREDFDDEKYLVYPRQASSDWMPAALDAIKVQLEALSEHADESPIGKDEMKQRMRAAALKRQAASKPKKRKARESQFAPGMGGGNSKAIYYKGGT